MAFKKHDARNLFVENNTVRGSMEVILADIHHSKKSQDHSKIKQDISVDFNNLSGAMSGAMSFFKSPRIDHSVQISKLKQNSPPRIAHNESLGRLNSFSQFMGIDLKTFNSINRLQSPQLQQHLRNAKSESQFTKGKGEIRQMLYPELPKDFIANEELWVPGNMSCSRATTANPNKIRVKMDTSYSSKFYTSYSKFKDLNIDDRNKPCVTTGSEYLTEAQKLRNEDREKDKDVIGPRHLKFAGKATKPFFIKNYVNLDYSEPVGNHKFRKTDKSKWVAGDYKLC